MIGIKENGVMKIVSGYVGKTDVTEQDILNAIITHNNSDTAHADMRSDIATAESIARGRNQARVFATTAMMNDWLDNTDNQALLNVGDNLFIVEREEPDWWWDGAQPQMLETEKVDLTDYFTKAEINNLLSGKVDILTFNVALDGKLGKTETAADSEKLGGQLPEHFANKEWAMNRESIVLANNTDLNTIVTPGNYRSLNDANAQSMLNTPIEMLGGFSLQVLRMGNAEHQVMQVLYTATNYGRCFYRYCTASGEWRNWLNMESTAKRIVDGTDFNNINNGNWYVNNSASAQTMFNLPIANMAGMLYCTALDASDTSARQQIYTTFNMTAVYGRGKSGSPSVWSEWRRIDRPDYSTTEQQTGEKWIDGKPIYRRVFTGNIVAAANALQATTLISSGIQNLVKSGGWLQLGSDSKILLGTTTAQNTFPQIETISSIYLTGAGALALQSASILARAGTTNNAYQIWVEYTKS